MKTTYNRLAKIETNCSGHMTKMATELKDCRNNNLTFYVEFCQTKPFVSLHSDVVRVSVVLGVVSQLAKLWQNES